MKPTVKRAVLAALVCALAVFALPALGDSQARIVRLSFLDGSVQIDRNTGQGFEKAISNMPITQGVKLGTGEDGEAEVEFENGSTVRLAPDTTVSFDQLSLRGDGGKVSLVRLGEGTAYFDVKVKDQDDFRIVYGSHDIHLAKSTHFRAEIADQRARVAVFKGELQLQGVDGEVKVKKNETLTLDLDEPSQYELAKGIDQGQYDWWDKEREDYHNQYAYNSKEQGYVDAPYSYGWSDLNYYGSFINIPGYGWGWRPYNVGYAWDPFATGYWVWYPGWGYTWISPYPWGWMPYRYGAWRFFPGYGWAWTPGYWQTAYYAPRVINPPPSYRPPRPPSNPRTTPVAVGNPSPTVGPRWTPGARGRQDDDRLGGRPGQRTDRPAPPGRTTSGTDATAGTKPSAAPTAQSDRPGRGQQPIDRDRATPGSRREGIGDVQRPEPRQSPRSTDTPRPERPTPRAESPAPRVENPAPRAVSPAPRAESPAPRMSPPPRSFDGGGSRPASAPSSPSPRSSSPPPARQPNPK